MNRTILTALTLVALLASLPASADLIRFEWTNNGTSATLLSASGYWDIDESDLAPGFGDYKDRITDFAFVWETSAGNFSSSSANGDQVARGFLNFDTGMDLIGFDVCFSVDGACDAQSSSPLILTRNAFWGATSGANQPNFVQAEQTVTMRRVVAEPGTLALLGIALLAAALLGRRRLTGRSGDSDDAGKERPAEDA